MGWPRAPAGRRAEVYSGDPDSTSLPGPLDRFSWRYQLREFQSRFHVVAVDLRGYGSSDAPRDVDCYTIDLLMADIQDVILGLGGDVPPHPSPGVCHPCLTSSWHLTYTSSSDPHPPAQVIPSASLWPMTGVHS